MDAGLDPGSAPGKLSDFYACNGCDGPLAAASGWCSDCEEMVVGYVVPYDDPLERPLPPRVADLAAQMARNAIDRALITGRIATADARMARIDAALAAVRKNAA